MNKNFKYLFLFIAALVLSLSLVACKNENTTTTKGNESSQTTTNSKEDVSSEVSIEKATKAYIKGTELDTKSGRIKIVTNGNAKYIPLSQENVSITGYDKETLGEQTLTVKYVSGENKYEATYKVTVYDIESAKMAQNPNRLSYKSHETELDLSGGFVEVSANNGEVVNRVELSKFEVTGFDSSLATKEYKTTPLKETISVKYNGNEICTFQVSITYSDVSFVKSVAKALNGFDPSVDGYNVDKATLDDSIDAIESYLTFTPSEYKSITQEELNQLLIATSVYGYASWYKLSEELNDTFAIVNGNLGFRLINYAATKKAVEFILEDDSELIRLSNILTTVRSIGSDTYINKDTTVEKYLINVVESDELILNANFLEFATSIYEAMEDVKDWDLSNITNYSDEIQSAFEIIVNSSYSENVNLRPAFGIISGWREKNDLFEAIYAYYYVLGLDTETSAFAKTCVNTLKRIYLPGQLEPLYSAMITSGLDLYELTNYYIFDSTYFVTGYKKLVEIAEKVFDEENPLYDMYETFYFYITFDNIVRQNGVYIEAGFSQIINYLRTAGLFEVYSNTLVSERLSAFYEKYLDVINKINTGLYETNEESEADFIELFNMYQLLSPTETYDANFTLCFAYASEKYFNYYIWNIPAFLERGTYDLLFVSMASNYFINKFENAGISAQGFVSLMISLEAYSRIRFDEKALNLFFDNMKAFNQEYSKLDATGKEMYDEYLGITIKKLNEYMSLYNQATQEIVNPIKEEDLGSNAHLFTELKTAYDYLNKLEEKRYYALEITEIMHILRIIDEIVNTKDSKVLAYFATGIYTYGNKSYTFDEMASNARYHLYSLIISNKGEIGNSGYVFYDLYNDDDVKEYLLSVVSFVEAYIDKANGLNVSYDLTLLKNALDKYMALDSEGRNSIYWLSPTESNLPVVLNAVIEYFKLTESEEFVEVIDALMNAEVKMTLYENGPDIVFEDESTTKGIALESYNEFNEKYESLSQSEKEKVLSLLSDLIEDLNQRKNSIK